MGIVYASDLDGTLLGTEKALSDRTVEIVNRLIKQGMLFTVITARTLFTVRPLVQRLNLELPVGIMNGSAVYDLRKNSFVATYPIEDGTLYRIIQSARSRGICPMMFCRKGEEVHVYYDGQLGMIEKRVLAENPHAAEFYHKVDDLGELVGRVEVLVVEGAGKPEGIRPMYEELKGDEGLHAVSYEDVYGSGFHHIEMFSSSTNKGIAALRIAQEIGGADLITFGDNYSDIDMFRVSRDSYAMSNGLDAAKKAAGHVIGHCDEDAVALCLAELFSGKDE